MITPLELLNLYLTDGKSRGNTSSELYQKFNRELTWDALLNEGYQQDLAPMLYYIINKYPTLLKGGEGGLLKEIQVSDEIKSKLKDLYNYYLVKNMIQFKELDTILDIFEKEGIDVIQLKGAWLAKNYYPEPELRPMSDLDLLVREKDMRRAKKCLSSQGYEFEKKPFFVDENSWERNFHFAGIKYGEVIPNIVELHSDIARQPAFIKYDIIEFWRNAVPINEDYKHILRLPKELLLLYSFWHMYKHISSRLYVRLIWLIDIVYLLKSDDMDWYFMTKKTKEWNIQKHVYFCLYLIAQLINIGLPEGRVETSKPSVLSKKIYDFVIFFKIRNDMKAFKNIDQTYVNLLNLLSLNTFSDRMKYIFQFLKPEQMRKYHGLSPEKKNNFIYIIHPLLLILKGFKHLSRILRDNKQY